MFDISFYVLFTMPEICLDSNTHISFCVDNHFNEEVILEWNQTKNMRPLKIH